MRSKVKLETNCEITLFFQITCNINQPEDSRESLKPARDCHTRGFLMNGYENNTPWARLFEILICKIDIIFTVSFTYSCCPLI